MCRRVMSEILLAQYCEYYVIRTKIFCRAKYCRKTPPTYANAANAKTAIHYWLKTQGLQTLTSEKKK